MMGCFLPCFGTSKCRKHLPSPHQTHVADDDVKRQTAGHHVPGEPITDTQSKIALEKQSTKRGIEKLTLDLNANANEELEESTIEAQKIEKEATPPINCGLEDTADGLKEEKKGEQVEEDEANRKLLPAESSESLFSLSIDSRKHVSAAAAAEKAEYEVDGPMPPGDAVSNTNEGSGSFGSTHDGVQGKPVKTEENLAQETPVKVKDSSELFIIKRKGTSKWNSYTKRKVNSDLNVNTNGEPSAQQLMRGSNKNKQDQNETPQASECPSGKSSHFSRYRYQGCSEEECGDFDLGDESVYDDGRGFKRTWIQEEPSESLFSLSTDSRKQAEKAENEVNSPMPSRGTESFFVLNPIENIIQGRVEKARAMKREKENVNSERGIDITGTPKSGESSCKAEHKKLGDENGEEMGVDTSLSSWLVEIEKTPDSSSSSSKNKNGTTTTSKRGWVSPEDRPILGALSVEELKNHSVTSKPSRRAISRSPDETPIIGTVGSYWNHTGQTIDSESPTSWGRIHKNRGTSYF